MYQVRRRTRSGSFYVKPPPKSTDKRIGTHKIRHMDYVDIQNVKILARYFGMVQAKMLFGNFDIEQLWSKSYVSILLECSDRVVATMMLNNYPNLPSIPTSSWESWLQRNYDVNFLSPENTLWVHLFLFRNEIRRDITDAFIKYIFKKYVHVKFVVMVFPPYLAQFEWISQFGTMISCPLMDRPRRSQRLLLLRRTNFVSSYTTRKAVIGDNDDIVALLDRTCPTLKELYGKHYIAGILTDNNSTREVIVAEYNKAIVAVMIVNSNVNYTMLNVGFHLEMLSGLRKISSDATFVGDVQKLDTNLTKVRSLSDFTIQTIQSGFLSGEVSKHIKFEESEENLSFVISDADFELYLDDDQQSVDSLVEIEPVVDEEKSDDALFIGHLENNMSCVVLSYTTCEIQKLLQARKSSSGRYPELSKSRTIVNTLHNLGEPNAYSIEAIAVAKTHAFAVTLLFLASYECFPNCDYCLLSLPCNEPTPPILKKFIRAHTRRDITIPHELYICHKLSVMGKFSAREAYSADSNAIYQLMGNQKSPKIVDMFSKSINDLHTSLRSYVFLCNSRIIGFSILNEEHDVEYIYTHFYCKESLADMQGGSMDYGHIMYFTVLPIFEKKTLFFLQELHRLSEYTKLFYTLDPQPKFVPCIIAEMTLVLPIEMSELKVTRDSCYDFPAALKESRAVSTLFISTPSLCSRPKFEINTRVVVVGASDVGLSFVIALLIKSNTGKQLIYNNITIVSAHGVNRSHSLTRFIPISSNVNKWTLDMHGLSAYVDVVEGIMTGINRTEKTITVSNNKICYDILILTCGVQYQMPKRFSETRKKRTENPENVFIINTEVDVSLCLERLQRTWSNRQNNVIVYGHSLNAYCCISTLLYMGLPENYLVFVDYVPPQEYKAGRIPIFKDHSIEDAVRAGLKKRGVRMYRGYLYTWDYDELEKIKSVTFECRNSTRRITLECVAFFAYETKYICQTTLQAFHSARLVFDGALVITPDFRTNDPSIFAAGTCTKYHKRYHAETQSHKYYNQVEIGRILANMMSEYLVTGEMHDPFEIFRCNGFKNDYYVPEYVDSVYANCILPGGINYLCIRNPGYLSHCAVYNQGELISTGNPYNVDAQGYCRLHINGYGVIDEISCLSKEPIEVLNLLNVWGKHNVLFKKLLTRYKVGEIKDFLAYFRGDEFTAIYNCMFPHLWDNLTKMLLTKPSDKYKKCLIDDILHIYKMNNEKKFKKIHLQFIKALFSGSVYEENVVKMTLNFLEEQRATLPMYTHPLTIPIIIAGYMDSNLFRHPDTKLLIKKKKKHFH